MDRSAFEKGAKPEPAKAGESIVCEQLADRFGIGIRRIRSEMIADQISGTGPAASRRRFCITTIDAVGSLPAVDVVGPRFRDEIAQENQQNADSSADQRRIQRRIYSSRRSDHFRRSRRSSPLLYPSINSTIVRHLKDVIRGRTSGREELRSGPQARWRRTVKIRSTVRWQPILEHIAEAARSDGVFPLLPNCRGRSVKEVLEAYRRQQPLIEKGHEVLKTVLAVTPMFLKNVARRRRS